MAHNWISCLMFIKFPPTAFLLLTTLFKSTLTDFRFCHHGPHRFDFKECPGGVLFKKPIDTDCVYFAKTSDIGDGRLQVNGDLCDSLVAEDADVTSSNPVHSFSVNKVRKDKVPNSLKCLYIPFQIQEITFDGDLKVGTEGVDLASTQLQCSDDCLSSWIDPEQLDDPSDPTVDNPDDHEQAYNFPQRSTDIENEQNRITKELFTKLLMDDNDDFPPSSNDLSRPDRRIIKLLRDSFSVMTTHCPNIFIPETFVDRTVKAMVYLLDESNTTIKDIGLREYDQVLKVLGQCRIFDRHSTFHIITKECEEPARIIGGKLTRRNGEPFVYKYKPRYFRHGKYDPFIESAWSAVGFVHGQCFRHFTSEFNIHHVYMVAMEAMFNVKSILERWVVAPPQLEDKTFWNNVMGVSDYEKVLQNVHACLKLAYQTESPASPYWKILERPFRQINETNNIPDPHEPTSDVRGWTNIEEYWKKYRQNGGIKRVLRYLGGTCYKSEAEREVAVSGIQNSCPPKE